MISKSFIIDFPEGSIANIYSMRYYNTARILDLEYTYESSHYGDDGYYYRFTVTGNPVDIERFIKFVDDTITYEPEIKLREL